MNNPFFVLTSDDNEIIGVIVNPYGPKAIPAIPSKKLEDSLTTALEHHYDTAVTKVIVPEYWADMHKPIPIIAQYNEYPPHIENPISTAFTLTAAWDY